MFESVAKIFLLIGLGYLLVLLGLKEKVGSKLSKAVFLFLLPLIMFNGLARSKLDVKHLNIVLVVVLYIFISLLLVTFIVKYLKLEEKTAISTIVSSVFLNSAFLPIPLAYSLYSNVLPVIVYTYALILTYYPTVDIIVSLKTRKPGMNFLVTSLKRISRNPIICSGILGVVFSVYNLHIYVPDGVWFVLEKVSVAGIYLSAIVVGLGLPIIRGVGVFLCKAIMVISFWRHIISPIIHYTLTIFLINNVMVFKQVMLESIMPPATINAVLAYIYGFDVETISKAIIISTMFSLTEVFVFIWLGII